MKHSTKQQKVRSTTTQPLASSYEYEAARRENVTITKKNVLCSVWDGGQLKLLDEAAGVARHEQQAMSCYGRVVWVRDEYVKLIVYTSPSLRGVVTYNTLLLARCWSIVLYQVPCAAE